MDFLSEMKGDKVLPIYPTHTKGRFDDFTPGINSEELVIRKGNGRFVAYPSILNKGEPLREIMRLTGLSPEEIVVAGDETADIPMMAPDISKHPVCPSNATDEVKQHVRTAGGIVGTKPYAEGVMEAFNHLLKNNPVMR
jgi:hydroxymethylpyrimidine pyrophosphatase-like HAD family hydrolase